MARYPQNELIRQIFVKGQPCTFSKGDIILGNDKQPNGVYYIASGYVKVYSISNNGDEYVHIIYGGGEIFPILWAYLDIEPQALFYTAISDCVLWRLSRFWFNHFISTRLDACYAFSVQLAQQSRVYTDRVDNLEYKKADERVAYRILFLASRFGTRQKDRIIIEPAITHEVLASTINMARESVSRELQHLVRQGIVSLEGHHIIILDVNALAKKLSRPINLNHWYLD